MQIDDSLICGLLAEAAENPRLRCSRDLRTTPADQSQRILNALQPGTVVPVHRHTGSTETLVLLCGRLEEIYYELSAEAVADGDSRCMDVCRRQVLCESQRILLSAEGPVRGLCIPQGQWHSIRVLEPTVILECKDGAYEPLKPEDVQSV